MAGVATPARRKQWLVMLWVSLALTIVFAIPGGVLFGLAFRPCPENQLNALRQCVPWSTIMWVLGPLFTVFGGISFIWFIMMVFLRFSAWYTRGDDALSDAAVSECDSEDTLVMSDEEVLVAVAGCKTLNEKKSSHKQLS